MLQPIIAPARAASHHVSCADVPPAVSANSDEGWPLVVPARPGSILAKAAEKFEKMKAALVLAGGSPIAIAATPRQAAQIAAPAPAATVAPAASTSAKMKCGGCGHELAEDEKTYKCSSCLGECCSSCSDETDDGVVCPKCGSAAAKAGTDALVAKMNASDCPEERFRIAARINQLEGMAFVSGADKERILATMEQILDAERNPEAIVRLARNIDAIKSQKFIPSAAALAIEGTSRETLLARLETANDPEERYRLAARINQLDGLEFLPVASKETVLAQMEKILDAERNPEAIVRLARNIDAIKSQKFIPSAAALAIEGTSRETLLARLETANDPEERYRLAARINQLDGLEFV